MAYYSDPSNLFPGYSTDGLTVAAFPVATLPTCDASNSRLNDIKEVLYSILSVVADDYAALPVYNSGVNVETRAKNFTITSSVAGNNDATSNKTFVVTFTVNSPLADVADENEYNPD